MTIVTYSLITSAADVTVIVNAKNSVTTLSINELNSLFIKKNRSWSNDTPVRFFDHRDENINRKIFLEKYIGKTTREIELFWIGEKIYTGNIAPIQVTSDSMMSTMVSRFNGGIGYVSNKYKIPKTVKKITITPSE